MNVTDMAETKKATTDNATLNATIMCCIQLLAPSSIFHQDLWRWDTTTTTVKAGVESSLTPLTPLALPGGGHRLGYRTTQSGIRIRREDAAAEVGCTSAYTALRGVESTGTTAARDLSEYDRYQKGGRVFYVRLEDYKPLRRCRRPSPSPYTTSTRDVRCAGEHGGGERMRPGTVCLRSTFAFAMGVRSYHPRSGPRYSETPRGNSELPQEYINQYIDPVLLSPPGRRCQRRHARHELAFCANLAICTWHRRLADTLQSSLLEDDRWT